MAYHEHVTKLIKGIINHADCAVSVFDGGYDNNDCVCAVMVDGAYSEDLTDSVIERYDMRSFASTLRIMGNAGRVTVASMFGNVSHVAVFDGHMRVL